MLNAHRTTLYALRSSHHALRSTLYALRSTLYALRLGSLLLHRAGHYTAHDLNDAGEQQRPEKNQQPARCEGAHRHRRPVMPLGASGAEWLATDPNEEKACDHLARALQ